MSILLHYRCVDVCRIYFEFYGILKYLSKCMGSAQKFLKSLFSLTPKNHFYLVKYLSI